MEDIKQPVDANSDNFKQGVEAGEPASVSLYKEPSPPLFLSDSSEGKKGNAQDEKDGTEE